MRYKSISGVIVLVMSLTASQGHTQSYTEGYKQSYTAIDTDKRSYLSINNNPVKVRLAYTSNVTANHNIVIDGKTVGSTQFKKGISKNVTLFVKADKPSKILCIRNKGIGICKSIGIKHVTVNNTIK